MKYKMILCSIGMGLLAGTLPAKSQSLKDLFNKDNIEKIAEAITDHDKEYDLIGTWDYKGFACELKSDNLLKKAGSQVGTLLVENKMNEYGEKLGLVPGKFSYIFKKDNTFVNNCGSHTFEGTYSLNEKTGIATLTYLKMFKFDAKIQLSHNKLCLLLDGDKLLGFITLISSYSDNVAMKKLSSLAEEYNGALLGFELSRQ